MTPHAWKSLKKSVKRIPGAEAAYVGLRHGPARMARFVRTAPAQMARAARAVPAQFSLRFGEDAWRLAQLHQRYHGRRGFVLGNGPSLLHTDPALLQNEITIASNAIFLMFEASPFRPTFYTVEDVLVAEDRAQRIDELTCATKVLPFDLRHCLRRTGETIYVNFVREYRRFPRFSDNATRIMYWGGTVTYMNLQLAFHLGLNPIYLIGVDHNYAIPADADVRGARITSRSDDPNHFHPDYFGAGYRWHDPRVDRMEIAYREARRFCEARGVKIFNATAGGKLEVFERVDYHSLFGNGTT